MQFGGIAGSTSFTDDFGNSWIPQGAAKVQTNQFKFGTGGLGGSGGANVLNGTTDFIRSSSFTSAPEASWSARAWVYATALPAAGNEATCFGLMNSAGAGGPGFAVGIYNNAGVIKFRPTVGAAAYGDIFSTVGTTTPLVNTWYFVELTYDALGGTYKLFVNGVAESSGASASRAGLPPNAAMHVGGTVNGGGFVSLTGYVDKFEYLPYCDHPAGVAYAVPTAAPVVSAAGYAQEWYDIGAGQMKRITAASAVASVNPTFGTVNRTYVGEADTGGAAVSAVRTYAYNRRYQSPLSAVPANATRTNFPANMGIDPRYIRVRVYLRFVAPFNGYLPGMVIEAFSYHNSGTYVTSLPMTVAENRTNISMGNENTIGILVPSPFSGPNVLATVPPGQGTAQLFVAAEAAF
jgi:hypothetical protein